MGKNLIYLIAAELGVEIEEEFKVTNDYDFYYKFTLNDLLVRSKNEEDWYESDDEAFIALIRGEEEIIKLPFEPKVGEYYWTYNSSDFCIIENYWDGLVAEYCKKACGCVFRTEQEAIKARPAKYKELTGNEWGCDDG